MWRVIENEIRSVVLQNTTDVEPRDSSQALLEKFFHDPRKIDLIYEKVIERVQSDRTRNPLILVRSLRLLKKYLIQYTPSPPTIQSIDKFCCSVAVNDTQTRNTLLYIRALLERSKCKQIPTSPVHKKMRSRSALVTVSRISRSSWSGLGPRESRLQIQDAMIKSNCIISNHILFRKRSNYDSILDKRSNVEGLSDHPGLNILLTGPKPIENLQERKSEQKRIEERIHTVSKAKKAKEIAACHKAGIPVGRNNIRMFQFKYYNEQEPLSLNDQETESLIQSVVDPPDYETRLIGSKILIKVLVDRFMLDAENASNFFVYEIASKMLKSGNTDTVLHVFALLFNLSVHCNLWEDMSVIDEEGKFFSTKKYIGVVQGQLFNVLQQILILLLRFEETKSLQEPHRVWPAALHCLLYWTTKDGNFQRNMLPKIEITLLPIFLTYSISSGDFVQRHLIRILCSLLNVNGSLQMSQLKKVGGIHWIIDQFVTIRSMEALDNLFAVIYDYVVLRTFKKKGQRLSDMYLLLFKKAQAPLLLAKCFCVMPANFVDVMTQILCDADEWNYSLSCDGVVETIDRKTLHKILQSFKSLSIDYLSLPAEFNYLMEECKNTSNFIHLQEHLFSSTKNHQRFAEIILFQLLVDYWLEKSNPSQFGIQVYELFLQLLEHKADFCHSLYVSIIQRVVIHLSCQQVDPETRSKKIQYIASFLNEHILKLFPLEELNENIPRNVFDILFRFIAVQESPMSQSATPFEESSKNDCGYSLFIHGFAYFPHQLKKGLDINVFGFLFDKITNKNYAEMRLAILLIMIDKCMRPENLEEIGGIPFFRKLLASRDPAIAYHASRFLIDQLEAERPEDYKEIMSTFLSTAQQSQNENLVSNSYLQIMALIRGTEPEED